MSDPRPEWGPEVRAEHARRAAMLGKRVRATIYRPKSGPAEVAEGVLLGFGEGGNFEILEDDGFVHYCWPMLTIEPVPVDTGEPEESRDE